MQFLKDSVQTVEVYFMITQVMCILVINDFPYFKNV